MFDQLFENFRKASESSLQMQQDIFKHLTQQWVAGAPNAAGASTEWTRAQQKRSLEMALELLNKHREALDSAYRSGIAVVEQTFRLSEAKSQEDYRRMVEDLWRKLFETVRDQSETQFKEFQRWSEKTVEMAQNAQA
jgi:hypothetical protein